MKFIIFVTFVVALGNAFPNQLSINQDLNDEWHLYKMKHGKVYEKMEELERRLIWEETVKYIQEHNIRYNLGQHSYYLGINQFSDLTHEEFLVKYIRSARPSKLNNSATFMAPLNVAELPTTVDWRTQGYVTPVKNQGQIGWSWPFSITGSLEGQYFRKNKNLLSFSEYQLVDCVDAICSRECSVGHFDCAYNYIQQKGLETEESYQYKNGTCNYNASKVATKIAGHTDIKSGSERQLMIAVATQGPISVTIDASNPSFQSYSGGVYDEPNCSSVNLDHSLLNVGYGTDTGIKYWLAKNNWGVGWGIKGYIEMSRDKNNQCGIATAASYPNM